MQSTDDWRSRLRMAIDHTNKKHSYIAREAGIDPTTLSRILTGRMHPRFETVVRVVHVCGETVGWLLEEYGFTYSKDERTQLAKAAEIILGYEDEELLAALDRDLR
jgi:transcriptional regulator with XRE-family HTH domain